MDHTIINNDCDVSWKDFLIARGLAKPDAQEKAEYFYQQYLKNTLDHNEFMDFQLIEFRNKTIDEINEMCQDHFESFVKKTIYPKAALAVKELLDAGKEVCLLTATNDFIARPLSDYLDIPVTLGTNLEIIDGKFTGKTVGTYCGGLGKVEYIEKYCADKGYTDTDVYYYGDSKMDIAVMEKVKNPIACNPAEALRERAEKESWTILDFA